MLRRFVIFVLVLAVAAALLVAAFPEVVGMQQRAPVAQLIAFRAVLALVAVVVAIVFIVVGLFARSARAFFGWAATLLIVFALITAGIVVARGTGSEKFSAKETGAVTVLSWNTEGAAVGADAIARLAVSSHADVVSLPETDNKTAVAVAALMKKSGVTMNPLTLAYNTTDPTKATSVLINSTLGTYTMSSDKTTTEILPTVVATPKSGTGPTIVAVHAASPRSDSMDAWRHGLTYLQKLCKGTNVIAAGDFNATLDHLAGLGVRSAALGDCRDAALATSNAGVGSWPTNIPALLGAPIDHVMTSSSWSVDGFRVVTTLDDAGSDHRPIVAQLTPKDTTAN